MVKPDKDSKPKKIKRSAGRGPKILISPEKGIIYCMLLSIIDFN